MKSENLEWTFTREVEGFKRYYDPDEQVVKQYLEILESRYEKTLTVRIYTDVSRRHRDDEEEEMRRAGIGSWFAYTDEDSFRKILNQMADIIEKHGLDWLAKISQEEEIIVTKAMNEKLFSQHKVLDREFIEKFRVKAAAQCEEDIDEWYRLINGIIEDIAGRPYEDAKEMLVKIAAFIGERAYDVGFQKWEFVNKSVSVRRNNLAAPPWLTLPLPLNSVVSSWNEKYEQCEEDPNLVELCFNAIKKMFLYQKKRQRPMNKKLFSKHKDMKC